MHGDLVPQVVRLCYFVFSHIAAVFNESPPPSDSTEPTNGVSAAPKKETTNNNKNELPLPKRIFFPREKVQVGWKGSDRKWQIGAGFVNVGNTCYLNSTLQALLHVPAMANWLASDSEHRDKCSEFSEYIHL